MALDKDILGDAMKAKVDALHIELLPYAERQDSRAVYRAIAEAVIEHIKTYGVVTVTTTLDPDLATSCPAGPGTLCAPVGLPQYADGTGTIS